jgi:transcriptional regulator with XRE-family HTH domain
MDDFRIGTLIRLVRQDRGWRQLDLAKRSGVSRPTISRIECGQIGPQSIDGLRAVARCLDIRVDLVPRWRGGDVYRLLNRGHSALHESVARRFRDELPDWVVAPEVSFAVYAERGVIDILAWHPGRRALLVIELKTDIVDVNELLGTFDRKRRLAARIARSRGWDPLSVSAWLIIRDSRTSRRRVAAHEAMLHGALRDDRRTIERWLRDPVGSVAGLSFWTDSRGTDRRPAQRPIRRVRVAGPSATERGRGPKGGPSRPPG